MSASPNNVLPVHQNILWSSVSRSGTILVEAGEDPFGGAVAEAARGVLSKKNTPGWEFYNAPKNMAPRLKAVKFHVYEHQDSTSDWEMGGSRIGEPIVWVFAAVYNPQAPGWENSKETLSDVQSFLQKIVGLTEDPRSVDPSWRSGGQLACQESFAPILLQRMQEVTYLGKMARVNQSLQDTTALMQSNINAILEREEQIQSLDEKGSKLQDMATAFKKNTKSVRRRMMLQNAKHGAVLGTLIVAGVAVVVVPPLVAVL